MSGTQSINLTPLSATQSAQFFGSTALQGVSVWQDKDNSSPAALTGTAASPTSLGTLYFPGAPLTVSGSGSGNPNIGSGRVITQSIALSSGANMLINP